MHHPAAPTTSSRGSSTARRKNALKGTHATCVEVWMLSTSLSACCFQLSSGRTVPLQVHQEIPYCDRTLHTTICRAAASAYLFVCGAGCSLCVCVCVCVGGGAPSGYSRWQWTHHGITVYPPPPFTVAATARRRPAHVRSVLSRQWKIGSVHHGSAISRPGGPERQRGKSDVA